jgi:hypothetical protein
MCLNRSVNPNTTCILVLLILLKINTQYFYYVGYDYWGINNLLLKSQNTMNVKIIMDSAVHSQIMIIITSESGYSDF